MRNQAKHISELSAREHYALACHSAILSYSGPYTGASPNRIAQLAVEHADALIRELDA